MISERGGLVFVRITGKLRSLRMLETSTEPPADALDWRRVETPGFLVFLPPWMKQLPRELHLEVTGRFRRRLSAFWNGCAYVI